MVCGRLLHNLIAVLIFGTCGSYLYLGLMFYVSKLVQNLSTSVGTENKNLLASRRMLNDFDILFFKS